MIYIMHRINTIRELDKIPVEFGVEIDIRGFGRKILLSHDPIDESKKYDELENYLKYYNHSFIIFNMKEAGYEQRVIELAEKLNLKDYFLLDVEFPYLYNATRKNRFRKIAVRYSEAEPIEFVNAQKENEIQLVDWIWIDTNTRLPLTKKIMEQMQGFKTCLVSPERWGRPDDIEKYAYFLSEQKIRIDAIMTSPEFVNIWRRSYG